MPVLAFKTKKEFESWVKAYLKPNRYVLFAATETSELIAQPTVSTRPRVVGYIKLSNGIEEYAKKIAEQFNINYFVLDRYGWDTDRHPSIKYKYEQE